MKLYLRSKNCIIKRTELVALCTEPGIGPRCLMRNGCFLTINSDDAKQLRFELNRIIDDQLFYPPKPQTQDTEASDVEKVLNKYIEIFRRLAESNLVNGAGTQSENVFGIRAEVYRRCAEALEGELKKADSE